MSEQSPARLPTTRRRFGRYETLFRIAGGGMAEVYAARILGEGGFQKVVALKRMLPTLAEDERFVTMFLDEGRVAANISSPHVVQTLDLGRAEDDSLYLVMELVVGLPLTHLIRGVLSTGVLVDVSVAAEIIAQAAMGLYDAHQATTPMGDPLHLIHRDISPQNILIDRGGRTRITDFGVARAMQRHSQTQAGEVKGKMAYFAPEQARSGELDHRVDIFALGIVAWETLAAKRLFKADNPLLTLRKIVEEPVPSLKAVRPDIPDALAEAVHRALQRDPADRYQSARDFAQALRASVTPIRPAELGTYVLRYGADALRPVEEGLRTALATTEGAVTGGAVAEKGLAGAASAAPTASESANPAPDKAVLAPEAPSLAGAAPEPAGTTRSAGSRKGLAIVATLAGLLAVGAGAYWMATPSPTATPLPALTDESPATAGTPEITDGVETEDVSGESAHGSAQGSEATAEPEDDSPAGEGAAPERTPRHPRGTPSRDRGGASLADLSAAAAALGAEEGTGETAGVTNTSPMAESPRSSDGTDMAQDALGMNPSSPMTSPPPSMNTASEMRPPRMTTMESTMSTTDTPSSMTGELLMGWDQ